MRSEKQLGVSRQRLWSALTLPLLAWVAVAIEDARLCVRPDAAEGETIAADDWVGQERRAIDTALNIDDDDLPKTRFGYDWSVLLHQHVADALAAIQGHC